MPSKGTQDPRLLASRYSFARQRLVLACSTVLPSGMLPALLGALARLVRLACNLLVSIST
jgi:hypothetical protein